jgi:hypothetical protein
MPTDAEREFARDEILEACREIYATSPAAWVGWERADIDEYDLIEAAARELVAEGLIKATFDESGSAVEAQLTEAGAKYLKLKS